MIRRLLAREMEFLLKEFDAPDARTPLLRAVFWGWVTIITTAALLGLIAIRNMFGLEWLWVAVIIIILLCARLTRYAPLYVQGPLALGSDGSALSPPAKQALPPSGTPQIGRSNQALTKHRPALPKRSPEAPADPT
jgi:hypothetical protein